MLKLAFGATSAQLIYEDIRRGCCEVVETYIGLHVFEHGDEKLLLASGDVDGRHGKLILLKLVIVGELEVDCFGDVSVIKGVQVEIVRSF